MDRARTHVPGGPFELIGKVGEALTAAESVDEVAHIAAEAALAAIPRAVAASVLAVNGRRFRAIASVGDLLVNADWTAVRSRAAHERRPIEATLAPGYRLSERPLLYREELFGLLEVAGPRGALADGTFELEWLSVHAAMALHRVQREGDRRSARNGDLAASFALGVKIATSARHGVPNVVGTLALELGLPVAAIRVPTDGSPCELVDSAGLAPAAVGELASLLGSRAGATREESLGFAECQVRAAVRADDITTVDAGAFAFVVGGACEALEDAGGALAQILRSGETADPPKAEDGWTAEDADRLRLEQLSDREREVLGMIVAGMGTQAISRSLVISPKTVKTHVQNILRKLDAESRLEAAAIAVRCGLVPETVA